jgi:hypothetical protein
MAIRTFHSLQGNPQPKVADSFPTILPAITLPPGPKEIMFDRIISQFGLGMAATVYPFFARARPQKKAGPGLET